MYNNTEAIKAAMGSAKSTIKNMDGSDVPLFKFESVDKIIAISSIYRDFPKHISKGIKQMALDGVIKPLHCYGNAYLVANYLLENGYKQVKVVDGVYRDLKHVRWGEDTHRFIQYINPDGRTRYYDPTLEVIPSTSQTWCWEYRALRIIELSEIERFADMSYEDSSAFHSFFNLPFGEDEFGYGSTLDNNKYRTSDKKSIFLHPFINDRGEFIGLFDQYHAGEVFYSSQMKAA